MYNQFHFESESRYRTYRRREFVFTLPLIVFAGVILPLLFTPVCYVYNLHSRHAGFGEMRYRARARVLCRKISSNCETRNGDDLGEILARVLRHRRLLRVFDASNETVFHCISTPSFARGRATSSFSFVTSSFPSRNVSAIKIAAKFLGMRYSPASVSRGFSC